MASSRPVNADAAGSCSPVTPISSPAPFPTGGCAHLVERSCSATRPPSVRTNDEPTAQPTKSHLVGRSWIFRLVDGAGDCRRRRARTADARPTTKSSARPCRCSCEMADDGSPHRCGSVRCAGAKCCTSAGGFRLGAQSASGGDRSDTITERSTPSRRPRLASRRWAHPDLARGISCDWRIVSVAP